MSANPIQYVTLVSGGGTPIRMADQLGKPYPTTGHGALVFNVNPTMYSAVFKGSITLDPGTDLGLDSGSVADPPLYFGDEDNLDGIYSSGPGHINIGINGEPIVDINGDGIVINGDITYTGELNGPYHSPLTTRGDIWYYGEADTRLPLGPPGSVMGSNGIDAVWVFAGAGTVTSIMGGDGISITPTNPLVNQGTISLMNSGVTVGIYGSAGKALTIEVDTYGRILTISETTAAPGNYLPLTGGTLSGPGNLTLHGTLTGTSASFSSNVNTLGNFQFNGQPVLLPEVDGNYTALRAPLSPVNNVTVGNATNATNYYTNTFHLFRAVDQTTPYMQIAGAGIEIFTPVTLNASFLTVKSSTDYGMIEIGGVTGAYLDLKVPESDDFDLRLYTLGSGGTVMSTGAIDLSGSGAVNTFVNGIHIVNAQTGVLNVYQPFSGTSGVFTDNSGNTQILQVTGTGVNGAGLLLFGDSATPRKWLRSIGGQFDIINNAYTAPLLVLKDDGLGIIGRSPDPASSNKEIASTEWVKARLTADVMVPTGSIIDYAGATAPTGWLMCQGQAVSRTTYAALFGVIGAYYGAGDGSTTFNLPDLRGRVIAAPDGGTGRLRNAYFPGGNDSNTLGHPGGIDAVQYNSYFGGFFVRVGGWAGNGSNYGYTASGYTTGAQYVAFTTGGESSGVGGLQFGGGGYAAQAHTHDGGAWTQGQGLNAYINSFGAHGVTDAANVASDVRTNVQPTIIMNKIIKT